MDYDLNTSSFDVADSRRRCLRFRRRILDISQRVSALHAASSFSCLEIVDTIYFGLMRRDSIGRFMDTFLMSKGHGALAQYVVLEEMGVLSADDLQRFGKVGGRVGTHPDYGLPGIEASTGSLGHGLSITVGMALADKHLGADRVIYVVLSDGELQEGSVWEAMMFAPTLKLKQLVAVVDLNDFQSLGRTSVTHPNFYPIVDKVRAFGWETTEVNGHDQQAIHRAITSRQGRSPMMLLAHTIKGKGVSFMENVPIWHYRSPSPEEYLRALAELPEEES
jgi:transketolase